MKTYNPQMAMGLMYPSALSTGSKPTRRHKVSNFQALYQSTMKEPYPPGFSPIDKRTPCASNQQMERPGFLQAYFHDSSNDDEIMVVPTQDDDFSMSVWAPQFRPSNDAGWTRTKRARIFADPMLRSLSE